MITSSSDASLKQESSWERTGSLSRPFSNDPVALSGLYVPPNSPKLTAVEQKASAEHRIKTLSGFIRCITTLRLLAARLRKQEEAELRAFRHVHINMSHPPKLKVRAQSFTSSVPNPGYILDLAGPEHPAPGALEASNRGVQKHPATFQCSLCPKRFTRAYNLRSHLRTHTDERPFVCNICGKAFARQHDRKRHEAIHTGEKKFLCRGKLKDDDQSTWGCGRRFARADALGRHYRSPTGRVCIKPLLEEEAALEKASASGSIMMAPACESNTQVYKLPEASLLQYPTLGRI